MNNSRLFVPDTHALVWDFQADRKLSRAAREVLRAAERGEAALLISTIVLAELLSLQERKMPRLSVRDSMERWNALGTVTIVPFDLSTFELVRGLPGSLEMHDRIIAATALLYGATVLTRDSALRGVVSTLW